MDRFSVLPRNLLRYVTEVLEAPPLTIASLRSLYERRPRLYEHQQWAKDYLGLRELDPAAEAALTATLALHAAESAHTDELVASACHWLYDHHILIPGQRRVQDWAPVTRLPRSKPVSEARSPPRSRPPQCVAALNRPIPNVPTPVAPTSSGSRPLRSAMALPRSPRPWRRSAISSRWASTSGPWPVSVFPSSVPTPKRSRRGALRRTEEPRTQGGPPGDRVGVLLASEPP
jgi:hypothetical protein